MTSSWVSIAALLIRGRREYQAFDAREVVEAHGGDRAIVEILQANIVIAPAVAHQALRSPGNNGPLMW